MPEKDDKSEKQTRTTVGIGNTEIDRETRSKSSDSSTYRDRDDRGGYGQERPGQERPGQERGGYRADRYEDSGYEDEDDYQERARRGARDLGESFRDAGRTARREGTDILTAGCDFIGGIFIGIGEAISPRRRGGGGSSRGGCGEITACGGYGRESSSYDDEGGETTYRGRYRSGNQSSGGARVSTSRTEVRRTSSR